MDLLYNLYLVGETNKSKTNMRLTSNVGTMAISHMTTVTGYQNSVWFSEK